MAQGVCLWCSHPKAVHNGAPKATKDRYAAEGHKIRWTPTACSLPECSGCRRYEVG